jgi:hypothetical protein
VKPPTPFDASARGDIFPPGRRCISAAADAGCGSSRDHLSTRVLGSAASASGRASSCALARSQGRPRLLRASWPMPNGLPNFIVGNRGADDRVLRPPERAAANCRAVSRVARDRSRHSEAGSRCRHVARPPATTAGVGHAQRAGRPGAVAAPGVTAPRARGRGLQRSGGTSLTPDAPRAPGRGYYWNSHSLDGRPARADEAHGLMFWF